MDLIYKTFFINGIIIKGIKLHDVEINCTKIVFVIITMKEYDDEPLKQVLRLK